MSIEIVSVQAMANQTGDFFEIQNEDGNDVITGHELEFVNSIW